MVFKLQPATPADLAEIVAQQYSAFYPHDLLHDIVNPGGPAAHAYLLSKHQKDFEKDTKKENTWLKVVDEETGKLVAAAKWVIFEDKQEWDELKVDVPEGKEDEKEWRQWLLDEYTSRRAERVRGRCIRRSISFVSRNSRML